MSCDHVIGSHGTRFIRKSEWTAALGYFSLGVHFHCITRAVVPPPGFVHPHAHCVDCGAKLDLGAAKASVSEILSDAIDVALGTGAVGSLDPVMDVSTYINWLTIMNEPVDAEDSPRVSAQQ